MEGESSQIPIIDFDQLGLHRSNDSFDKTALKNVGDVIKNAFSTVGFCYLKNHGIEESLMDKYFDISREFFQQPTEEKMKLVRGTELNFGWVALEREKPNTERPGDLKECFNYIPKDDLGKWPSACFQTETKELFFKCAELSYRVCDALSVGLGLRETFIRDAHTFIGRKGNDSTFRSLYYPPIRSDSSIKPGQIRLGEHSDYGTVTLLFQDDIGGLEVEIPGKGFVHATPIPGTVVLTIGDLMQRWTADALIATKHRVLIPEAKVKKQKHRQSVAFFVVPDDDYIIECLDGSRTYEPISSLDYLSKKFSLTY